MTTSVPCAHPPCRRRTRNASGRCQDHPFPIRPDGSTALPLSLDPAAPPGPDEPRSIEHGDGTLEVIYGTTESPHREHGPAYTCFYPDGRITEKWFAHGELHRRGGPATTSYYRDGSVEEEVWNAAGQIHRLDGPAHFFYSRNGKSDFARDYVLGNLAIDGIGAELERIGAEKALVAIELSPFSLLLDEGVSSEQITECLAAGVRSIQGVREVLGGAPAEWVRSWEEGREAS